jgi:hypothetical protein
MRYRLRTLLLLLAILPPLLWIGWGRYEAWKAEQDRARAERAEQAARERQRAVIRLWFDYDRSAMPPPVAFSGD